MPIVRPSDECVLISGAGTAYEWTEETELVNEFNNGMQVVRNPGDISGVGVSEVDCAWKPVQSTTGNIQ